MSGLLLRGGEVLGPRPVVGARDVAPGALDVRVRDGVVVEVGPALPPSVDDEVFDVGGAAVLPGLHDHHIHLLSLAASRRSVSVGPPEVGDVAGLRAALRRVRTADGTGDGSGSAGRWIRAVGYHESVAGDLDRAALDAIVTDRPVRVQHRAGALWVLNSRAIEELDLGRALGHPGVELDALGEPTGRLWRADDLLRELSSADDGPAGAAPDLAWVGELLARCGVTGVTDATPSTAASAVHALAAAVRSGALPQLVVATGGPSLDPAAFAGPGSDGVSVGPVKLLLADHGDPSYDDVLAGVRAARSQGRPVAVHAVTAVTVAMLIAALDQLGAVPGDRIEHGSVIPRSAVDRLVALGVTVVTNPGFVATRGDRYRRDVAIPEQADLWRCGSLDVAGVPVAAGTDAPFGDPDPWASIAAAVDRRTSEGDVLGAGEAVSRRRALDLFLGRWESPGGPARRVRVGGPADLCVLGEPLDVELRDPRSVRPVATVSRGSLRRW